jgi:integration host factor subunit alpha
MALTKADLVERLFNVLGINKREAKEVVDLLFDEIIQALERGENVKLSGFGVFDWRDKKERPGRNPKTGEPVAISARRVITFRVGENLKSKVETYKGASAPADAEK